MAHLSFRVGYLLFLNYPENGSRKFLQNVSNIPMYLAFQKARVFICTILRTSDLLLVVYVSAKEKYRIVNMYN
jgi:hypothetical protein